MIRARTTCGIATPRQITTTPTGRPTPSGFFVAPTDFARETPPPHNESPTPQQPDGYAVRPPQPNRTTIRRLPSRKPGRSRGRVPRVAHSHSLDNRVPRLVRPAASRVVHRASPQALFALRAKQWHPNHHLTPSAPRPAVLTCSKQLKDDSPLAGHERRGSMIKVPDTLPFSAPKIKTGYRHNDSRGEYGCRSRSSLSTWPWN